MHEPRTRVPGRDHDAHFDVLDTMFLRRVARALGSHWAANGVDLRELESRNRRGRQDSVLPWRSVIVMIVLLKDACTCAIASSTFLRTFLRAGLPPARPPLSALCF